MPSFKYERSFTSADSEYHQPPLSLLLLSLDPPLTRLVDKNGLLDKGHIMTFSCMAFFSWEKCHIYNVWPFTQGKNHYSKPIVEVHLTKTY